MFRNKHATVIGPTPPGTGVIAPATQGFVEGNVADDTLLAGFAVNAVDSDVDDNGAALDPIAPDHCALPTAATRMSAARHSAARSIVFECAIVTVQSSANKSIAIGLPTMFDRPSTTAFIPRRSQSWLLIRRRHPGGVRGKRTFAP